jgi:hypothetical protein
MGMRAVWHWGGRQRQHVADLLDDSIPHQALFRGSMINRDIGIVSFILKFPGVLLLVVEQLGVVVPLVQVLKYS